MVMKRRMTMIGWMALACAGAQAAILLSDGFSGTAGASLVGSALDVGETWDKEQTDGSGTMSGDFLFANGGGIVSLNNAGGSAYTVFNAANHAGSLADGFTLSTTFAANGYDGLSFTLGLAEAIDKGHFINLVSGDVIRLTYFVGGTNAGTFKWGVFENGVQLDNSASVRFGTQSVDPSDTIRLAITCFPASGIVVGEAYNLTGDYLLSRSGLTFNTPALTNTLYAGLGFTALSVANPDDPAVVKSFTVVSENLSEARPLDALSEALPPVMTGFAFEDFGANSETNPLFSYVLEEHAPIDIMHAVRSSVYNTVRATYPDKILIRQMAWGGSAGVPLDTFWPGHCLLKVGTKLTSGCAATTNNTVLYLEDYALIATKQSTIDNATDPAKHVVLYALDANGKPDWSRAEHVKLLSVDTAAGSVTVQRGQQGTVPQEFVAGQAAIARHMMFWSNQWQLNFSLECPRGGPFNMTAAEWYALQVAQRIRADGADGVEFDVARWQWGYPASNPMDCDNDLAADYGYIGGINSFGLGGQLFLRELRTLLGPDRIIQMDGNDALYGQRGFKYVNGVQMESFPQGNHFDSFSEAFLHLRQWVARVEPSPAFSYPFSKTPTTLFGNAYDTDGSPVDWRFRTGYAAALLTGMPHPFASITDINFDPDDPEPNDPNLEEDKGFYKWDEYVGGDLNNWKWLGAPQGAAVQVQDQVESDNLLAAAAWQWNTEPGFAANCAVSNGAYWATISQLPSNTMPWTSAYYTGSQIPQALWFGTRLEFASGAPTLAPGEEYTLEFEAKGNDSWNVAGQLFEKVPRSLVIDGVANHGYNNPASVFLNPEWTTFRFSIIADSNAPPPLVFGFSEQLGSAAIRNIRLYKGGAERWTREFRNGRVYLNMTRKPWKVEVGPGVAQRLLGTQNPHIHNGLVVGGALTVPAWDAAFLRTGTFDAWRTAQFGLAVSDDFSTGFGGRDPGDPLVGFAVQTGLGAWTNAYTSGTGSLNGGMAFAAGGLTEAVGGGGGVYVPLAGLGDTFSMEVVVTPNDFSDGNFAVGFVETVDKGFFNNINSDDALKFRYIHTGANAGRFQFAATDEGVLVNSIYSTRTGSAPATSDTVRLTLSYDAASGAATGIAYNVTGGYELSNKAISVPGLANMLNAGFGWSSITNQTETPSANPGIVSYFRAGDALALLGESVSGATADPDGDGATNFEEYMAGTGPLDSQSLFALGGSISASAVELSWPAASNRLYDLYWTTNLLQGFETLETGIAWPQSAYTNALPDGAASGFYNIKVRRP